MIILPPAKQAPYIERVYDDKGLYQKKIKNYTRLQGTSEKNKFIKWTEFRLIHLASHSKTCLRESMDKVGMSNIFILVPLRGTCP